MNTRTIQELCKISSGSKTPAKTGLKEGKYPFFTSGKSHKYYVNSFNYDTKGIVVGRGGSPNWHYVEGKFDMSTDCCLLESKSEDIDIKYLYYYLCAYPSSFMRFFKGAGLKHISIQDIKATKIEYPDLSIQKVIVQRLSTIDEIIEKRKKNITDFAEVLKNYYLETIQNAKGFKETFVNDIKEDIKTGPFGSQLKKSQIKEDGDVYVIGFDNIGSNYFTKGAKRYITNEELPKYKRYIVKEGDVLVSVMGTIGRSAVVPSDIGRAINTKHLVDITVDKDKCNPYYLSFALSHSPHIKAQFERKKKGAIMSGLNMTDIKELKIGLPNIKVQDYFELLYKDFHSLLQKLNKSLQLLEELRKSLLQLYIIENKAPSWSPTTTDDKDSDSKVRIIELLDIVNSGRISNMEQYNVLKEKLFSYIESGKIIQSFDEEQNRIKLELS